MNKITKITLVIIALAFLGYGASFFVSPPSETTGNDISSFHWALANSILYTSLHIGAAILFLIGLKAYKAKLRLAYGAVAFGIVLVGGGLAHVVLLRIFGLLASPWVQYGGVMLPFVAAGLAIYLGIRLRARLVNLRSPLANLAVILPLLLLCIFGSSFLPHGTSPLSEVFFDVSNAINVFDAVFYAASLGLVLQIKNRSGAHYTSSMVWLIYGLMGSVAITLTILITTLITGEAPTGYLLDSLVIVGGFLYLKAGHSFAKTAEL